MLKLRSEIKIYVSITPIDMRKSIDGLSALVPHSLMGKPLSGHVYVFFNRSRDRVNLLYWDRTAIPKKPESIAEADESIHIASHTRKKSPGRKSLPAELPREQHIHDLSEDEKICPCGHELTHIKDEKCEQLEFIPAKFM